MAAPCEKTASEELAEYKAERARNWPSRANIERKTAQLSEMQARGELNLQADAHKRKLRLQSILEQQRKLGHFEASRECAALVSGSDDQRANVARKKQRKHEAPRGKEQHIPGVVKPAASAADESRRQREREAALARMRGTLEPPANADAAAAAKDASPLNAKGAAVAQKRRPGEPAHAHVATHAAQAKAAPSLLAKLLATEIRRERSHLLQAFRFLSRSGLLDEASSR